MANNQPTEITVCPNTNPLVIEIERGEEVLFNSPTQDAELHFPRDPFVDEPGERWYEVQKGETLLLTVSQTARGPYPYMVRCDGSLVGDPGDVPKGGPRIIVRD